MDFIRNLCREAKKSISSNLTIYFTTETICNEFNWKYRPGKDSYYLIAELPDTMDVKEFHQLITTLFVGASVEYCQMLQAGYIYSVKFTKTATEGTTGGSVYCVACEQQRCKNKFHMLS
jgi:hypothetical protein